MHFGPDVFLKQEGRTRHIIRIASFIIDNASAQLSIVKLFAKFTYIDLIETFFIPTDIFVFDL